MAFYWIFALPNLYGIFRFPFFMIFFFDTFNRIIFLLSQKSIFLCEAKNGWQNISIWKMTSFGIAKIITCFIYSIWLCFIALHAFALPKKAFKMDNFRSEHDVHCRMAHSAPHFLAFPEKTQFPNTAQHCSYIKNKLKSNFKVIIVMVDATEEEKKWAKRKSCENRNLFCARCADVNAPVSGFDCFAHK